MENESNLGNHLTRQEAELVRTLLAQLVPSSSM